MSEDVPDRTDAGSGPGESIPTPSKRAPISLGRIAIWVGVGGFGLYLIITGLVGMIVKSQ